MKVAPKWMASRSSRVMITYIIYGGTGMRCPRHKMSSRFLLWVSRMARRCDWWCRSMSSTTALRSSSSFLRKAACSSDNPERNAVLSSTRPMRKAV